MQRDIQRHSSQSGLFKRTLAAIALSGAFLTGCADQELTPVQLETAQSFVENINNAPLQVAYRGVRHWQIGGEAFGDPLEVLLTEVVQTDGQGGFELKALNYSVNGGELNQPFGELYAIRQGFLFRYRDPHVFDFERLMSNYTLLDGGATKLIAGRTAFELVLKPQSKYKSGSTYSIWVDFETSLITGLSEWDPKGQLLVSFEYSTLDVGQPSDEGFKPFQSVVAQNGLGDPEQWNETMGFDVREPSYVPRGFGLLEGRVTRSPGEPAWAMMVYTDGVQPVFFLHRKLQGSGTSLASSKIGGGFDDGVTLEGEGLDTDLLHAESAGWHILRANHGDQDEFLAIGRVDVDKLQLMIETALP